MSDLWKGAPFVKKGVARTQQSPPLVHSTYATDH